jgi:predicted amidohydrolase
MSTLEAAGAELVFCPAITFGEKSMRMWRHEFPTDAVRHSLVICGSNRRGAEAPWNVPFPGGTYAVDPNGLLENMSEHEGLVVVDADLGGPGSSDPAGWDLAANARPGIYGKSG